MFTTQYPDSFLIWTLCVKLCSHVDESMCFWTTVEYRKKRFCLYFFFHLNLQSLSPNIAMLTLNVICLITEMRQWRLCSSLYWNLISDFSCIQKSVLLFYPLSNWRWVNQTLGIRIHYIARASIINVWTHYCLHYLIIIFHHNLRMEFWNMYEWSCSVRSEKGRNRRGNRRKLCKLVNIDVDKFDTSY